MRRIFSFACFSIILLIANIPTDAQTPALTLPDVLTKVHKAVGYKAIKKLRHGFSVEEIRDSGEIRILECGHIPRGLAARGDLS